MFPLLLLLGVVGYSFYSRRQEPVNIANLSWNEVPRTNSQIDPDRLVKCSYVLPELLAIKRNLAFQGYLVAANQIQELYIDKGCYIKTAVDVTRSRDGIVISDSVKPGVRPIFPTDKEP